MLPIKWTDEAKTDLYTLIAFIAEENLTLLSHCSSRFKNPFSRQQNIPICSARVEFRARAKLLHTPIIF